jgi:DNA-binding NarL/FixJ family response regulator
MTKAFLRAIKAQEPHIVGQEKTVKFPRKPKEKLSDRYIGIIIRHKKRGLTFKQIARDLRLDYHTVYNAYHRYKEFAG